MKVTYVGPSADVEINGVVVPRDGSAEFPAEVAESLIASGDFVASKKSTKAEEAAS